MQTRLKYFFPDHISLNILGDKSIKSYWFSMFYQSHHLLDIYGSAEMFRAAFWVCFTCSITVFYTFALTSTGQMTQLCELINKSGELLAKNLSHLDTVLGALDIQEHSLGVLAVL